MIEKEILSAVKYVSRMKPEFMLSEIKQYVKGDYTVGQLFDAINPHLYDLRLSCSAENGDYKIRRAPAPAPLKLNDEETKRHEAFLETSRVPRKLERLVESYIEKKTGKKWDNPAVIEKIRKAILDQKEQYWKEGAKRKISYEKGYSILGYLAYQFPVYFVQFEHIFYELALDGVLKDRMKILDAGSGPGTVSLAIIDFYNRQNTGEAKVYAMEMYDENIEAYSSIVPEYASVKSKISIEPPIKADISNLNMEAIPDNLDLIVFSNVLNELRVKTIEQRAEIVTKIAEKLSGDGSIIIIEPADKVNSIEMRNLTTELMNKGLGVYSPCSFIWCAKDKCRSKECWSFEQKDDIQPTGLMKKTSETDEPFRYLNTDIKYTYAVLRKDTLTRNKYQVPPRAKFARLSKMQIHVGKRINVVASKMSRDLGDRKNMIFKLCDGTSQKQVYAVIPAHGVGPGNEALRNADYGDVIGIENVLVRYNEEKDAYNLLIGAASITYDIKEGPE